jgi:tetratricopeptide (TPR) repeat protein
MAYKPPNTASYHIQMARSFYDEARKVDEEAPTVGDIRAHMPRNGALADIHVSDADIHNASQQRVAEDQLKSLRKAIEHLNQARALDPGAIVSYPSQNKEEAEQGIKLKATVDQMYAKVLSLEGIAHLNIATAIQTDHSDGTMNRKYRREGIDHLEAGRDAFIKSLKYDPYASHAKHYLETAYYYLGDSANYAIFRDQKRTELQRQIDSDPENIELHKQMQQLIQGPGMARPLFGSAGFSISLRGVLTGMLLFGIFFIILGIATNSGTIGLGIFLLVVAAIVAWTKEKLSMWFG